MPLQPVKRLIKAKPAIEGAGVRNGPAVNRLPAFVRNVGHLEPTTLRLTAERLIAASHCKHKTYTREKPIILEFGGTLGGLQTLLKGPVSEMPVYRPQCRSEERRDL